MSKGYLKFVDSVTSDASKHHIDFVDALMIMEEQGAKPSRLLTAALGLNGEAAEFSEIIKKCIFQGKEFDAHTEDRLKSELSDVMWYIAQACNALDLDFQTIVVTNMMKLAARYPDGEFDIFQSENRKEGDI